MNRASLCAGLRFADMPGLPATARRALLDAFGSPAALFDAPDDAIAAVGGAAAVRAIRTGVPGDPDAAARADAALAWLDAPGNGIVTFGDPGYPARLADLHDPPPLLYVKGRMALLHAPAIAIVGSRHATPQGAADATRFARQLSDAGFAIVSGLALGIDGAAHRGGLDGASSTIAVIGTGADLVYPARHRALAHEIAERGAIVSEWPLGTPARAAHFPQRNRLIAAFARGVLVVEAAPRSGSLITARLANEMGREVFAIPGSIHAPLALGCHALIRDGAKLTVTPEDVLEEFGGLDAVRATASGAGRGGVHAGDHAGDHAGNRAGNRAGVRTDVRTGSRTDVRTGLRPEARTNEQSPLTGLDNHLPPAERAILAALGHGPVTFEWLAERVPLPDDVLHRALLTLELAGRIATLPCGRLVRLDAHTAPPQTRDGPGVLQSGE